MSGFLTPPTFTPSVPPIALGTAGQVLTMVNGVPAFAAGGGGGTLLGRVSYATPAGSQNNVAPGGGFPTNKSRLVVTLAGNATWTGLVAGTDGQLVYLTNADAADSLTLTSQDAGSLAANQFLYAGGGIVLPPGASKLLLYDATLALWCIA